MKANQSLGRKFGWLWAAYAVSTFGTWLAFDAFALIAIIVRHAGPTEVSALAAAGLAVGALLAVPLGPWMEHRRKCPVMIAMDLIRFAAFLSVPAMFAFGRLTFTQLLIVSFIAGAADITFKAASGAFLKTLMPAEQLLIANGRFESTNWTATALGPPLVGAAIGAFGPVTTVIANAAMTALWGLLASITSLRVAIAIAGVSMLATIPLLPRHEPKQSCPEDRRLTARRGNGADAGAYRLQEQKQKHCGCNAIE